MVVQKSRKFGQEWCNELGPSFKASLAGEGVVTGLEERKGSAGRGRERIGGGD